jgi:hypothetical protein
VDSAGTLQRQILISSPPLATEGKISSQPSRAYPKTLPFLIAIAHKSLAAKDNEDPKTSLLGATRTGFLPTTVSGSGLAAFCLQDFIAESLGNPQVDQIFFQEFEGMSLYTIRELRYSTSGEINSTIIAEVVLNFATQVYQTNLPAVRVGSTNKSVFYQDQNDKICEARWDGTTWSNLGPIW